MNKKKKMISKGHTNLSISKQCKALEVHRSSYYYQTRGESELNITLMRLMDAHYLEHPDKGARRMHTWLTKDKGYLVNIKRVERLYKVMGLRSLLPGPHTTKRNKEHDVYPYLLRDLEITHANQVWATDISYIPLQKGFMYLTALIDLHSRYIVGWSLSNTMEASWCKEMVDEAVAKNGAPIILNTDQGCQYTSKEFSQGVHAHDIKLSMDGKGRATDNAFIERFWRSIKYEKLYLNPAEDGHELHKQIEDYICYYNNERRHSSIKNNTPAQYYLKNKKHAA